MSDPFGALMASAELKHDSAKHFTTGVTGVTGVTRDSPPSINLRKASCGDGYVTLSMPISPCDYIMLRAKSFERH